MAKPNDTHVFKTHIYPRATLQRSTCTYDVAARAGSRRIFIINCQDASDEGKRSRFVTLKITKIADPAAFSRPPRSQ